MVKMIKYRLYCGRNKVIDGDVSQVTDENIYNFERTALRELFEAWTSFDADGSWKGDHERTIVYEFIVEPTVDNHSKVLAAREAYKLAFHQESVMMTSELIDVSF